MNDKKLQKGQRCQLADGDIISLTKPLDAAARTCKNYMSSNQVLNLFLYNTRAAEVSHEFCALSSLRVC